MHVVGDYAHGTVSTTISALCDSLIQPFIMTLKKVAAEAFGKKECVLSETAHMLLKYLEVFLCFS